MMSVQNAVISFIFFFTKRPAQNLINEKKKLKNLKKCTPQNMELSSCRLFVKKKYKLYAC
jgi:hypothetical protein